MDQGSTVPLGSPTASRGLPYCILRILLSFCERKYKGSVDGRGKVKRNSQEDNNCCSVPLIHCLQPSSHGSRMPRSHHAILASLFIFPATLVHPPLPTDYYLWAWLPPPCDPVLPFGGFISLFAQWPLTCCGLENNGQSETMQLLLKGGWQSELLGVTGK